MERTKWETVLLLVTLLVVAATASSALAQTPEERLQGAKIAMQLLAHYEEWHSLRNNVVDLWGQVAQQDSISSSDLTQLEEKVKAKADELLRLAWDFREKAKSAGPWDFEGMVQDRAGVAARYLWNATTALRHVLFEIRDMKASTYGSMTWRLAYTSSTLWLEIADLRSDLAIMELNRLSRGRPGETP